MIYFDYDHVCDVQLRFLRDLFYEQKCFRLLGNVYIRLLEHGEFDLSSMVAGEMANLGQTAIEEGNTDLIDIIIIRFNNKFWIIRVKSKFFPQRD